MNQKIKNTTTLLLASFIISAGWNWSYTARQPHWKFLIIANLYWLGIFLGFALLMLIYKKLTAKKHEYWTGFFFNKIPQIFLLFSIGFLTFFCKSELLNILFIFFLSVTLFIFLHRQFKFHPTEKSWQQINKNVFIFGILFFVILSLLQYIGHKYYILENKTTTNIVILLRAIALSLFWLVGLIWSQIFFYKNQGIKKWTLLVFWLSTFILSLVFWAINLGILIASGLYLSPIAIEHASGAGGVILNKITIILTLSLIAGVSIFIFILVKLFQSNRNIKIKTWYYFGYFILGFFLLTVTTIAPIKNTPEVKVLSAFYNFYFHQDAEITLTANILNKLSSQFGISYQTDQFFVNRKEKIYNQTIKLLPEKFYKQKPNIVIIFVESLSSNLTNIYPDLKEKNVTPNLKTFSEEKDTTIFTNYYNASTPTVTGILAQLCSFLPPTGHTEINDTGHWDKFYLRCLPNILHDDGNFKDSAYVTAVEKNYANKSTIYESIGVKKTYGTEELYNFISGKPLGWGWTDHQMFNALPKIMDKMEEPFLFMFSTVDTHFPYTKSKDVIKYGTGESVVLSSYYTTDDAFGKFWQDFKKSRYYPNTITIVVADHAMFPGSYGDIPSYENDPEYMNLSYYDKTIFMIHIPNTILPKKVDTYASSLDFAPTLLQILNINTSTTFEGYSIFEDRKKYPNLLGMHEFGLYINQETKTGRQISYDIPSNLNSSCKNSTTTSTPELTLCEFEQFYKWKRQMLEQGRLWFK